MRIESPRYIGLLDEQFACIYMTRKGGEELS